MTGTQGEIEEIRARRLSNEVEGLRTADHCNAS